VQEGMGHVPDKDGRGRKSILQDDGHHPSELHCLIPAPPTILVPWQTFASWNAGGPADEE
jgi:hypothetical protein